MYTYYDKTKRKFIEQKTKSKSKNKILITAEILDQNTIGTYGQLDGQYTALIEGEYFYWDDLRKKINNPDFDIVVFKLDECFVFIDR